MRWILYAAAADPALTGLFMLASPWLFGQLILGADFSGPALALGRIGGAAMFSRIGVMALLCDADTGLSGPADL